MNAKTFAHASRLRKNKSPAEHSRPATGKENKTGIQDSRTRSLGAATELTFQSLDGTAFRRKGAGEMS